MKLLSLLGDENSSASSIAACIATDPIFSARMLRRANAADVAGYVPASDVLQALVTIGIERTRELTLTIATVAYLGSALKEQQLRRCWRHMVACALASSEIARACGMPSAEAYTAGLLHDIGRLGLMTAYRSDYERTMTQAGEQDGDLLTLERERFGVDHCEAGCWLAERWNLPGIIAKVARHHHDAPSETLDLLSIVKVACRLADWLGYSVREQPSTLEFEEITAVLPRSAQINLAASLTRLNTEIAEQIAFFGYADSELPVRPVEVKIQEDEENDFLIDFPSPDSVPAPLQKRSSGRSWAVMVAGAVIVLAVVVLALWELGYRWK
jgi:putative nucleotidyltransferase with HDIG domain